MPEAEQNAISPAMDCGIKFIERSQEESDHLGNMPVIRKHPIA